MQVWSTVTYDEYDVWLYDGGQSVSNGDGRSALRRGVQCVLKRDTYYGRLALRRGVQRVLKRDTYYGRSALRHSVQYVLKRNNIMNVLPSVA